MIIEKRSIPMAVVFSLVTCGLYMLYWEYKILDSMYKANNQPSSAGVDVLLSLVTCGIYGLYMLYQAGKMESRAMEAYGLPPRDDAFLYVLLGVFGLGIVSFCILQSNLNNLLADKVNEAYYDPQQRPF